jgi:internalin A
MSGTAYELEPNDDGLSLVVTGPWGSASARELQRPEITGLTLNYARGFQERDLEFLADWQVKELRLLARTITDLEPVYRLSGSLERLSVRSSQRASLDLRRLPWLTQLSAEWAQVESTLEFAVALNDLFLLSYTGADLRPLARNEVLSRLRFKDRPGLGSLDGVEQLPNLVELGVFGARRLTDVTAVASAASTLQRLDLGGCSRLLDLDALAPLTGLRWLGIDNCGPVTSLEPIGGLLDLEVLWAFESTRVVDGDLTPLLRLTALRDLRMAPRQHYRPTLDEVRAVLGMEPWGRYP